MVPPAYSSISGCGLSRTSASVRDGLSGPLFRISVIAHLSLIEPHRRVVASRQRAGEHAPNEEAQRTETHHQGCNVGTDDLEIDGHRSLLLGGHAVPTAAGEDASAAAARCGASAWNVGYVRRAGLELGIVERRAITGCDRQRFARQRILV